MFPTKTRMTHGSEENISRHCLRWVLITAARKELLNATLKLLCRTNRQRFNWFPEGSARFRPRLGIRRFGEDFLHDAIERVKPLTDGPDSDRTAEFEALILARVVGGPVGKARSVRIARFRELCPVSAHDLAEFFVVRAALPITREWIAQKPKILPMVRAELRPLTSADVGKIIQIRFLAC